MFLIVRSRCVRTMKYEGSCKRLDVTTYVIQLYDVVKVIFLCDKTRHEHSRTAWPAEGMRKIHGHYNVIFLRVAERRVER